MAFVTLMALMTMMTLITFVKLMPVILVELGTLELLGGGIGDQLPHKQEGQSPVT